MVRTRWAAIAGGSDGRGTRARSRARNQVIPAAWKISGALNATVPNVDHAILAHPVRGTSAHVVACADPDLELINVDIIQMP